MNYQDYLKSDYWKHIRRKKYGKKERRRKYGCQICRSKERLELHHLKYLNLGKENLGRLRIVCHNCHSILHKIPVKKNTLKYIYLKRYYLDKYNKIPQKIKSFLDNLTN